MMKQRNWVVLLAAAGWLAVACAAQDAQDQETPVAAVPTALPAASLPTAVPPEGVTDVWAISFSYEFPGDFWPVGQHQYGFFMDCPELGQLESAGEWRFFQVTNAAPSFEQPIYFRLAGLSTGSLDPINVDAINPGQATIAVVTILGISEEQALAATDSATCEIVFGWDGMRAENLIAGEPFRP